MALKYAVNHWEGPPKDDKLTTAQKYRKKKKGAERNHVEGKFGQGKRGYGLNNIKARLPETSESWINAIIFIMNLVKLLQVAEKYAGTFLSLFKTYWFFMKNHLKFVFGHTATISYLKIETKA